MGKEWHGRKEYQYVSPIDLLSPIMGVRTVLYDNKGRKVEAWGKNKEESRDNAYRKWDEKYR